LADFGSKFGDAGLDHLLSKDDSKDVILHDKSDRWSTQLQIESCIVSSEFSILQRCHVTSPTLLKSQRCHRLRGETLDD
jgi:hypothetical protein